MFSSQTSYENETSALMTSLHLFRGTGKKKKKFSCVCEGKSLLKSLSRLTRILIMTKNSIGGGKITLG